MTIIPTTSQLSSPTPEPTRSELVLRWITGNNLIVEKHDPGSLAVNPTGYGYRTVLSHDMAAGLTGMLQHEEFYLCEYENRNPVHSDVYYELEPHDTQFEIPGSGIPPHSNVPNEDCDRLVIVPYDGGTKYKVFCEKASKIADRVNDGSLVPKRIDIE